MTTAWGLEVAEHADSGEIVPFCSAADPFHYKGRRNRHCETLLSLAEIAIKITPGLTPFSPSIKLGGTAPRASCFQTTSCRHAHSTANKTSGGSCGRTGCQTNSLTTSQIIAATRGRPWSISVKNHVRRPGDWPSGTSCRHQLSRILVNGNAMMAFWAYKYVDLHPQNRSPLMFARIVTPRFGLSFPVRSRWTTTASAARRTHREAHHLPRIIHMRLLGWVFALARRYSMGARSPLGARWAP